MSESPKGKRAAKGATKTGATKTGMTSGAAALGAKQDRTSSVVAWSLILLTVLGVVTVFWEPLAAIAAGGAVNEQAGEPRALVPDGGAAPAAAAPPPADASGNS